MRGTRIATLTDEQSSLDEGEERDFARSRYGFEVIRRKLFKIRQASRRSAEELVGLGFDV